MKQLTSENFNRACHFLKTEARPLERALFEHRFEQASFQAVIDALITYQNEDGGFHGLEPDVRTPSSSALATSMALIILEEIQCPPDHSIIQNVTQFLLDTCDETTKTWRVIPEDTNDYPHAPWWHNENDSVAKTFHNFTIIPRATIVALLHHFPQHTSQKWLHDLTEQTVSDIEKNPLSDFGDELRMALPLIETNAVPESIKNRLRPLFEKAMPSAVERDPNNWHKYCTPPLWIAPLPNSAFADLLAQDVQNHLDYQIDHQTDSGTWEPFWTWGNDETGAWETAKKEWTGHLTLETLTSLKAFARIAKT